jgi:hypothetical protein
MKSNTILGTVLVLSLAVIIAVAAVAPALAHGGKSDPPSTDNYPQYSAGGNVILQLPPATGHPTDLMIVAYDVEKRSAFGAGDIMVVYLWVPALNMYLPVADIIDTSNPDLIAWAKAIFAGLPIAQNIIPVADKELEVWKCGDVLTANLTVPVTIKLPAVPFGGDFTILPIAIEFRGFDETFRDKSTGVFPSGWKYSITRIERPAWVQVWTSWVSIGTYRNVGTLYVHETATYTPPPAP